MQIHIATLFPDMISSALGESIIGRALKREKADIEIYIHNIRHFTADKHGHADDTPYGGGFGMLLLAEPIFQCFEHALRQAHGQLRPIYMSPKGRRLTQEVCRELSSGENLFLLCGHYEGVDERVLVKCGFEHLSIGDFVLTGGELAALAVVDSVCRLVPGVLPSPEVFQKETHWVEGKVEAPQYTKPSFWRDMPVPDVLLSGNHKLINEYFNE